MFKAFIIFKTCVFKLSDQLGGKKNVKENTNSVGSVICLDFVGNAHGFWAEVPGKAGSFGPETGSDPFGNFWGEGFLRDAER